MKNLIYILSITLFTLGSLETNAQDLTQGRPSSEINERVGNELQFYTKELALTGKQQKLAQLKLTEFEMQEQKIIGAKMTTAKKKKEIKALGVNKAREMRDILSGPQYDKYVELIKEKRKANKANMNKQ